MTTHALRPGRAEVAARRVVSLYVLALVAAPFLALAYFAVADGPSAFVARATTPVAVAALWLTLWTALVVAVIQTVLGTATAWVLVRYRVPGRLLLSALVDLPLAIPTLVAGVMIAVLYGPSSFFGERLGLEIVFATPGILLALLFVTLPLVVRAVEPVLEAIDPAEEEAAIALGAGPLRTFRTVFFPAILPAAMSGGIRAFGRAVAEFGAIVIVAGNVPFETLTAPVFVFGEIESGEPRAAAAVSFVLLVLALTIHAGAAWLENRTGARRAER